MIEGKHKSLREIADDPTTTTRSIIDFAGHAEDAVARCNADKESARRLLNKRLLP